MTLEEVKQKLKVFDKYTFEEDTHTYYCNGKKVGISTTGLIHQYTNEFDKDGMSKLVANKRGISQQEVLEEWRIDNLHSTIKGNHIHLYAQSLWLKEPYDIYDFSDVPDEIDKTRLKQELSNMKIQAEQFYNDYSKDYELIGCEIYLGCEDFDECGATDILLWHKTKNFVKPLDFKSNKKIEFEGYRHQKLLLPLDKYEDCNYITYSLQLSDYSYKIFYETGIKCREPEIVYFDCTKTNYEIIKPLDLTDEIIKILKLRRANKMAKMILVMGEPASGKTVSLRNIPKNELYYIDCDKKGLNYKGWKNDFNEENKNYFKTNDGELIAKCMQGISEKREDIHYIVIDTINSIMIADEMRRSKDKNFDKWIDLASCIFNLVNIVPDLRDDITVIFIGHTQTDDEGFTRLLTNGKKLNKIGLEKYFDTVLIAKNNDGKYVFETKSPNSTARTPMGSYDDEQYIDNDLYEVIKVLKEY